MKKLILFIAALMLVSIPAFSGSTSAVYNSPTFCQEGPAGTGWVMYYGYTDSCSVANTDSTGDHYTKAMWIPYYTESDCFFNMQSSNSAGGTEDCNVYVEYSYDRTTWFVGSANSGKIYDQLTTTMVADTLNVIVGSRDTFYKTAPWMRLHFDWQAGNPCGSVTSWRLIFRKPAAYTKYPTYNIQNKL
jgi:hypothetical protein